MNKKDLYANTKMFLFARYLATCYADEHMNANGKSQHDMEYDPAEGMSVLNLEDGYWYMEQLKHFNDVVYPNYIKGGGVKEASEFITKNHG